MNAPPWQGLDAAFTVRDSHEVGSSIGEAFNMMWHQEKAMQAQVDALVDG